MASILRIGTRGSDLALVQARAVAERLRAREFESEIVVITTTGDRRSRIPMPGEIGKALWTFEIEQALSTGEIDLAVHSLKDLPADLPEGLCIGATLPREDPRDVLIGAERPVAPGDLPPGSRVGTGSVRRAAALRRANPEIEVVPLKGNVPTRLGRLEAGDFDAVVLAAAGLNRLGIAPAGALPLDPAVMPPALCQGIVGIEIRESDLDAPWLSGIDDPDTSALAAAERALLEVLNVGCGAPVGGHARPVDGVLVLRGAVLRPDGSELHEAEAVGGVEDAAALGRAVGETLVDEAGALLELLRASGAGSGA